MKNRLNICVDTLVLEVTRRCNCCCDHCLRGEQQDMDMPKEVIDKVLDTFDFISNVIFTGGEPSLNLDAIHYFFEQAELRGKIPFSFFIATNGLENQYELACLLLKYYPLMEEPECCEVCISQDRFHPFGTKDPALRVSPLAGLSFYQKDSKAHNDNESDDWLINEGNADRHDLGCRKSMGAMPLNISSEGDGEVRFEQLYVSANGNIQENCDLSYEHIDGLALTTLDGLCDYVQGQLY